MPEKSLSEAKELYGNHLRDVFDDIEVTVEITPTGKIPNKQGKKENNYNVVGFKFNDNMRDIHPEYAEIFDAISKKVRIDNASEGKTYSNKRNGWSGFYLVKELVEQVESICENNEKLFFRGQNNCWKLEPSAYRSGSGGYKDEYREDFEEIYRDIAYKYPNKIKYHEPGKRKRSFALAELQHYGLPTPLVDITNNPFIAMLFMIDGFEYSRLKNHPNDSPEFDIFLIDKDVDSLYEHVPRNSNNPRIDAQDGSFLNFEKLIFNKKLSKIKRIKILFHNKDDEEFEDANGSKTSIQNAFDGLVCDIKSKLNDFHYTNESLYPDFDKYLEFTKNDYKSISKVVKVDDSLREELGTI